MDNLRNILIQHNYLQQDNLYIKNKKAYVSHIELTEIDDRYISFVLKRIYNSKTIELINYKRLMYKFINIIENVIINESSLDVGDSNLHSKLFHCEIYCSGCEETIIDRINSFFFVILKDSYPFMKHNLGDVLSLLIKKQRILL